MTRRVVAYVPDLMDRSRLASVPGLTFVATPGELVGVEADVVVVDLSRPGVLEVLPAITAARVVAFGSHVDTDLLDAARAAGAEVLPRSRFFADPGWFVSQK